MATAQDPRIVIASQGDTLSYLCWREYGRSSGVLEVVLAANPHLAPYASAAPLVLPIGTRVVLPPVSEPVGQPGTLQLWS